MSFFTRYETAQKYAEKIEIVEDIASFATRNLLVNNGFGGRSREPAVDDFMVALNSALMEHRPYYHKFNVDAEKGLPDALKEKEKDMVESLALAMVYAVANSLQTHEIVVPSFRLLLKNANPQLIKKVESEFLKQLKEEIGVDNPKVSFWDFKKTKRTATVDYAFENALDCAEQMQARIVALHAVGLLVDKMSSKTSTLYKKAKDSLYEILSVQYNEAMTTAIGFGALTNEENLNKVLKKIVERRMHIPGSKKDDGVKLSIIQYIQNDLTHPGSYTHKEYDALFDSIKEKYEERFPGEEIVKTAKVKKKKMG